MHSWDFSDKEIKITFLGGLGEIGMNCFALESKSEIVLVDCGVLFTDLDAFGIDLVTPNFTYVLERKEKFKGFLITHGHEDHIGSLPFAIQAGLIAPIYATPFTQKLIESKLSEFEFDHPIEMKTYEFGSEVQFDSFKFKSVPVNHSIPESSAFIIETPAGKIFHSADFRFDDSPQIGERLSETVLKKIGKEGIDLLLSDSTNIESHQANPSESEITKTLSGMFRKSKGLSVVSLFSSNIARLSQVFEAAKQAGKFVAISGRGVELNAQIATEQGYLKYDHLVELDELLDMPRDSGVLIVTGSQGEYRSALARISTGDHSRISLQSGDQVILSARMIPGNERNIARMINRLFELGVEVHYQRDKKIHVSGHASRPELKKLIECLRPKRFVPVHGEYRFLVFHQRLAKECGVPETELLKNGEQLIFGKNRFKVQPVFNDIKRFTDLAQIGYVSKRMYKDRLRLAEAGVVSIALLIDQERLKVWSSPKIHLYGVSAEEENSFWIKEIEIWVSELVREYHQNENNRFKGLGIEEAIRVGVRRRFRDSIERRPHVFVSVLSSS